MSMTVSIRVKHNSQAKAGGQRRHDMRSGPVPKYVDQERSEQNSVIQEPMMEAEAREQCLLLRARRNCKRAMKKDAAVLSAGIITFGSEAQPVIEALPVAEQDQLYQEVAQRLASELDTRLVGLVVHRDESAQHAHFNLLAYTRQGWPLSTVLNPDKAKRLQDIAGEVMQAHGLGITRGTSKAQRIADGDDWSKINHMTVKELHEGIDLMRANYLNLEKGIAKAEAKKEKNERLAAAALERAESEGEATEKHRKNAAIYQRRAEDARAEIEALTVKKEAFTQEVQRAEIEGRAAICQVVPASTPPVVTVTIKTGLFSTEQRQVIDLQEFKEYDRQMAFYAKHSEDEKQDLRIENQQLRNQLADPYVAAALQQKQQDAMQQQQGLQQREALKNQKLAELRQQQQPAQQPQPAPFFNPFRP